MKVPLRSINGKDFLESKDAILKRWAEHFSILLNINRSVDLEHIKSIPQLPVLDLLHEPPTCDETTRAINQQPNKRVAGMNSMLGELIKYGGDKLHLAIWDFFVRLWETEHIPVDFKMYL